MDKHPLTCVLISDFNLHNLAGYLNADENFPSLQAAAAPYGQAVPALIDRDAPIWRNAPDVAVVWTRPEAVVPAYNQLLAYQPVALKTVLQQVDDYAALLETMSGWVKHAFVPLWPAPSPRRVFSLLDMKTKIGPTNTVLRMNLRLMEHLEKTTSNAHVLDTQRWISQAGAQSFNPTLWYLGKIPFGKDVFKAAVRDVKAALSGMLGRARKLIIVDLDDTLWGGIVGDVGWENLVLGGHHHRGEAYADFQRALKSMKNRGIVLAIASKNDERTAIEAIAGHPEMVLRLEDFAARRINWQDKAGNIVDMLAELNLGPQSAVFIDDSPAERARVRESLPEILVPDWPQDPLLFPSTLLGLDCFETASLSREDADRTEMYLSESSRRALRNSVGSVQEWLSGLQIRVQAEELRPANLPRAAQLLNKTNQMNLSTRRLSEAELAGWAAAPNRKLWTVRVSDKFGDAGLTGIVSLEVQEGDARIVDFILSCRVMGRRIEEFMLAEAIDYARRAGADRVSARYLPTAKNRPCLEFFESLSPRFQRQGDSFVRDEREPFPYPDHIERID